MQFMTEMKETAFVTQNITPRSLVLVDELGRATSSSDGLAIAWSCSEYLLSLRAYTIFATHMQRLVELASIYPNVKVCHFQVAITNNRLDFKYTLKEGHAKIDHYGLLLAEVAGFPTKVIEEAKSITGKLTEEVYVYIVQAVFTYQLTHRAETAVSRFFQSSCSFFVTGPLRAIYLSGFRNLAGLTMDIPFTFPCAGITMLLKGSCAYDMQI
eukprot:c6496_g1_i2 orf=466-1101(-)